MKDFQFNLQKKKELIENNLKKEKRQTELEEKEAKELVGKKLSEQKARLEANFKRNFDAQLEKAVFEKEREIKRKFNSELRNKMKDYALSQRKALERKRQALKLEIAKKAQELLG